MPTEQENLPETNIFGPLKRTSLAVIGLIVGILVLIVASCIIIPIAVSRRGGSRTSDKGDGSKSDEQPRLDEKTKLTQAIQRFVGNLATLGTDSDVSLVKNGLDDLRKGCSAAMLTDAESDALLKAQLDVPMREFIDKIATEAAGKSDAEQAPIESKINELIELKLAKDYCGFTALSLISHFKAEEAEKKKVNKGGKNTPKGSTAPKSAPAPDNVTLKQGIGTKEAKTPQLPADAGTLYPKILHIVSMPVSDFMEALQLDPDVLKTPSIVFKTIDEMLKNDSSVVYSDISENIQLLIAFSLVSEMAKAGAIIVDDFFPQFYKSHPYLATYQLLSDDLEVVSNKVQQYLVDQFKNPAVSSKLKILFNDLFHSGYQSFYQNRYWEIIPLTYYFDEIKNQLGLSDDRLDIWESYLNVVSLLEKLKVISKKKPEQISEIDRTLIYSVNFNPLSWLPSLAPIGRFLNPKILDVPFPLSDAAKACKIYNSDNTPTLEEYRLVQSNLPQPEDQEIRKNWLKNNLNLVLENGRKEIKDSFSLYNGLLEFSIACKDYLTKVKSIGAEQLVMKNLDSFKNTLLPRNLTSLKIKNSLLFKLNFLTGKLTFGNTPFNLKVYQMIYSLTRFPPDLETYFSQTPKFSNITPECQKYFNQKEALLKSCHVSMLGLEKGNLISTINELHGLRAQCSVPDNLKIDKFPLNSANISEVYDLLIRKDFPQLSVQYKDFLDSYFKNTKLDETILQEFGRYNEIVSALNLGRSSSCPVARFDNPVASPADLVREKFFCKFPILGSTVTPAVAKAHLQTALDVLKQDMADLNVTSFTSDPYGFDELILKDGSGFNMNVAKEGVKKYLASKLLNIHNPESFDKQRQLYSSYLTKLGLAPIGSNSRIGIIYARLSDTFDNIKKKGLVLTDGLVSMFCADVTLFIQHFIVFSNCKDFFTLIDEMRSFGGGFEISPLIPLIFYIFDTTRIYKDNTWSLDKTIIKKLLGPNQSSDDILYIYSRAKYQLESFKIRSINEGLIETGDPISATIDQCLKEFGAKIQFNSIDDLWKIFAKVADQSTFATAFLELSGQLDFKSKPFIAIQALEMILFTYQFDMQFRTLLLACLWEMPSEIKAHLRNYYSENSFPFMFVPQAVKKLKILRRDCSLSSPIFKKFFKQIDIWINEAKPK